MRSKNFTMQSDLLDYANKVLDDGEKWLSTPHPLLDGKTPAEADPIKVREILNAIEHGGVA